MIYIGKFLSVDPLAADYPWYTPYQFSGNMPIAAIDVDGLEPEIRKRPLWLKDKIMSADEVNALLNENYQRVLSTRLVVRNEAGKHSFNKQAAFRASMMISGFSSKTKASEISNRERQKILKQYSEFEHSAKEALRKYDHLFFNGQLAKEVSAAKAQRARAVAEKRAQGKLAAYQAAVGEGKVSAFIDISIGLGSVAVSAMAFESNVLSVAGIAFGIDQIAGGLLTLNAIDNGLFDPNKEYRIVKGIVVDNTGEGGALLYDLTNIGVNLGNVGTTIKSLNGIKTVSGKELNSIVGATLEGVDAARTTKSLADDE